MHSFLLVPFETDEPPQALFQRKNGLTALVFIINVTKILLNKPIAVLSKKAPFGLQACYLYTYRHLADEVDGVVKYYLHVFHDDMTLSADEFGSTKPDYEMYSFSEMGFDIRTCVSGSTNCIDSALVHGMAFVSAAPAGLAPRIESDYVMELVDSSTPGTAGKRSDVGGLCQQHECVLLGRLYGTSFGGKRDLQRHETAGSSP
ncbi:unnamed protein product [Peronospora effusa]|nr:unnamed protein product [Peronospora effusa]